MALAPLVSFQKQKQDQKHYEFASLISLLFASLSLGLNT